MKTKRIVYLLNFLFRNELNSKKKQLYSELNVKHHEDNNQPTSSAVFKITSNYNQSMSVNRNISKSKSKERLSLQNPNENFNTINANTKSSSSTTTNNKIKDQIRSFV